MTFFRSIVLATTLTFGGCNIVSGLTDFAVTGDGGVGAAGGGGAGGCSDCGAHVWSKAYPSEGESRGHRIAADKSGNVIVAGQATADFSFGEGVLPATLGWDVVVAKLGSVGSLNWSQRFGGADDEWLSGLAQDSDGNLLLVGYFNHQIQFGQSGIEAGTAGTSDYDAFLVKLEGDSGDVVWGHGLGSGGPQNAADVAAGPTGEVVVVGSFRNGIDLVGTLLPPAAGPGQTDIFLARFDGAGEHGWSKAFGDGGDDFGAAVEVDPDGNMVVAGHFEGELDLGAGPGTSDAEMTAFVAKLADDGTPIWTVIAAGQGVQKVRSIALDGDSIVVAGTFDQEIRLGTETHEATALTLWVAKLGHDGAVQWSAHFPGATEEEGHNPTVSLDSEGNILLTGPLKGTASFGGGLLTSETDATDDPTLDIFVAKLDSAGNHLWSQSYGGIATDYGAGIAADFQGNVLVTGTFDVVVDFQGAELKANRDSVFVLKLTP